VHIGHLSQPAHLVRGALRHDEAEPTLEATPMQRCSERTEVCRGRPAANPRMSERDVDGTIAGLHTGRNRVVYGELR